MFSSRVKHGETVKKKPFPNEKEWLYIPYALKKYDRVSLLTAPLYPEHLANYIVCLGFFLTKLSLAL